MFVTHDIEEALRLADRIILFNDGQIEQIGTPDEMIFHPKTAYVKDFFGLKGVGAEPALGLGLLFFSVQVALSLLGGVAYAAGLHRRSIVDGGGKVPKVS